MSYGTLQIEKMTTESGYSLGAGNASSFKNRIINGSCVINQRGSQSGIGANSVYTIDRWLLARENASQAARFTVTNTALTSSDTPLSQDGLSYTLQANVTTASGGISAGFSNYITQRIEGYNVADFGWGTSSAKSVTVSFWAKTVNTTGTMAVSLYSTAGRNYVQTISLTTSWQKFTLTFPGDTGGSILTADNSSQLQLMFVLSAGSNFQVTPNQWNAGFANSASGQADFTDSTSNIFYLTGVQLEVGTVATSFDFRSIGTELQLCQRYFQSFSYLYGGIVAVGTTFTTSAGSIPFNLYFPMRTAPSTITLPTVGSGSGQWTVLTPAGGYPGTFGSITATSATANNFRLDFSGYTGVFASSGQAAFLYPSGSGTTVVTASAEL